MENKNVGYLLIGLSLVIIGIIFLFNSALRQIVNESCTMAGHESCQMYYTITQQTYLSLSIVGLLIIVSLLLVQPRVGIFSILGGIVSIIFGLLIGIDKSIIQTGVIGFNSVLIGAAFGKFLRPDVIRYTGAALFVLIGVLMFLNKI